MLSLPRLGWLAAMLALYLLHQDVWFWDETRPLVFGFLPIGLAYHGAYCLGVAVLMWALTRFAWPHHLEIVSAGSPEGNLPDVRLDQGGVRREQPIDKGSRR
ncbi:MAG: hypothetical protein ACRD15_20665 [Vicinamibacterales bacterium]